MSDGSAKPANDPAMGNHNLRGGKGGQQGPGTMATDTGVSGPAGPQDAKAAGPSRSPLLTC